MTQYSKAIALFLSAGFLLTGTISLNAQQRKGLKKGPNVSLNITNKKKRTSQNVFQSGVVQQLCPAQWRRNQCHLEHRTPQFIWTSSIRTG